MVFRFAYDKFQRPAELTTLPSQSSDNTMGNVFTREHVVTGIRPEAHMLPYDEKNKEELIDEVRNLSVCMDRKIRDERIFVEKYSELQQQYVSIIRENHTTIAENSRIVDENSKMVAENKRLKKEIRRLVLTHGLESPEVHH